MKYFTPDIIEIVTSGIDWDKHAQTWNELCELYYPEYEESMRRLSKKTVQFIKKNDEFHDYHIILFSYFGSIRRRKDRFVLTVTDEKRTYDISFYGVNNFTVKINDKNSFDCKIREFQDILYTEYLPDTDGKVIINLITTDLSEFNFSCKGITITSAKNK